MVIQNLTAISDPHHTRPCALLKNCQNQKSLWDIPFVGSFLKNLKYNMFFFLGQSYSHTFLSKNLHILYVQTSTSTHICLISYSHTFLDAIAYFQVLTD